MVTWAHTSPQTKRHLDGFSCFTGLTIVTDRPTNRPRYSICNNRPHRRSTAMWPKTGLFAFWLQYKPLWKINYINISVSLFEHVFVVFIVSLHYALDTRRQSQFTDKIKCKSKVNLDICKAPLNTIAFSKALRYGNTVLSANKPYLPLLPSRRASHRPLAGTHFTVPRRAEGWVDLGGWLHTEIKCRPRESNPDTVTHPSTNRAQRRLTSLIETNALPLRQTAWRLREFPQRLAADQISHKHNVMKYMAWPPKKIATKGFIALTAQVGCTQPQNKSSEKLHHGKGAN